ncbi:MAG: hypothetical protein IRZ07_26755 [Microbispora sp.]|nr:hypothetical protein [Microbispora sp.]
MATAEWIESAARSEPKPLGDTLNRRADYYLAGATVPAEAIEVERAARLAWREAADVAAAFGLPTPGRPASSREAHGADLLDMLQRTIWRDGDDAARKVVADLTAEERQAARQELARRRGKR